MDPYAMLKLDNQLCFPLYAAAKEVVRLYTPYLDALGLTYTQYIAMLVVWEAGHITVKELGRRLFLDTGTLTPLLKKLAQKGLVRLSPSPKDRRSVVVRATEAGMALREQAKEVPAQVGACVRLNGQEAKTLYETAYKLLHNIRERDGDHRDTTTV